MTASAAPLVGEMSVGKTTTCRFVLGPRAGTTVDFAPFGVAPIPVGSPCTDGQGSTGIAQAPFAN